jgi:hypothetical protein
MTNHIAQSIPTLAQYSIKALSTMATALNGEQSPLNPRAITMLTESYVDGVPLLTLPEVTVFNGVEFLTGGRHRTASLVEEYGDDLSKYVTVLVYTVNTAEELLQRIQASNGSRKMSSSEDKALHVACKFGFSALSVDELCLVAVKHNDIESFTLALAMSLRTSNTELSDVGSLKVAQAIVTQLKKVKVRRDTDATYDTDGVMLTPANSRTVKLLESTMSGESPDIAAFVSGSYSDDALHEIADSLGTQPTMTDVRLALIRDELLSLVETIVITVTYVKTATITLPAKVYFTGKIKGVFANEATEVVSNSSVVYTTVLGVPSDWQRKASSWSAVFSVALTEALICD